MKFQKINKTYIIPTLYGLSFSVLILVMLFMAFIYLNNLIYAAVFFIISLSIQNMIRCAKNVENFDMHLTNIDPLFAGEVGRIPCEAQSKKLQKLYDIELYHPLMTTELTVVPLIYKKKEERFHILIQPPLRGEFSVGHIKVVSRFPFDFFKSWKTLAFEQKFLVYPERKGTSLFDAHSKFLLGKDEDDFQHHEEYHISSPPQRLDWKVYARTQELYVKKYSSQSVMNASFNWDDLTHFSSVEAKLSQLSLWIYEAHHHQMEFSLKLPHRYFASSGSRSHYHECLKELALCSIS